MNSKTKIVVACVLSFVVGFFAGQEYLKYRMRSAMQEAAGLFRESLGLASPTKPAAEPSKSDTAKKDQPLGVILVSKDFNPKDIHNGKFEEEVTFTITFKNATAKDIRAFDGVLEFTDLLGNRILASKVEINERIANAASLNWDGALEYNQFIDEHQRLRSEPAENLKINFEAGKVLYADGTTQEL